MGGCGKISSHDCSSMRACHHIEKFLFGKKILACSQKKRHECNFFLDINFAQNYTFV